MLLLIIATLAAGLFAGAAIYVSAVEHPARVSCGTELALRQFAPSYHRAAIMQGSLAVMGCLAGIGGAWERGDFVAALGALLLGAVVPFTLMVIFPVNARLLDPALDAKSHETSVLLSRWAQLHAVRSGLSSVAFLVLAMRLGAAS
jgi:Domain of unknown function (DUF1772)